MGDRLNRPENKIYYSEMKLYDASSSHFNLLEHDQCHFQNKK